VVFVCIIISHRSVSLDLVPGAEHIGIITPYFAQGCKIKSLLNRNPRLEGATVGSVEEFQGQVDIAPCVLGPCA